MRATEYRSSRQAAGGACPVKNLAAFLAGFLRTTSQNVFYGVGIASQSFAAGERIAEVFYGSVIKCLLGLSVAHAAGLVSLGQGCLFVSV